MPFLSRELDSGSLTPSYDMTPRFEPFTTTKCCNKQKQAKKLALYSGQKFQAWRFLSIPESSLTNFRWALKRNQPKNTN